MKVHLFNTAAADFTQMLGRFSLGKESRHISKSYTKGVMALYASKTMKMAVDIEVKKERSPQVIRHFIEKFATFGIDSIPSAPDSLWFYRAWTAMESYFKLCGSGFSTPKDFTLDLDCKAIWQRGKQVAWVEHFDVDNIATNKNGVNNFIFCLCGGAPFHRGDVGLRYHEGNAKQEEIIFMAEAGGRG